MTEFQERVVNERIELDAKRFKLAEFSRGAIFPTLPEAEQDRLNRQAAAMAQYSEVLCERIEGFKE